jgi:peptide/nickel transport system permease protein
MGGPALPGLPPDRRDFRRQEAFYRRLLAFYPPGFRKRFGSDMVQVFRSRLAEERAGGTRGVVPFWLWILADLMRSSARERLEAIEGFRMGGGAISGGGSGMFRFVIRRVLISLPVLLLASIIVFLVIRTSFDPFAGLALNPRVRPGDIARLKHELGLDRPLAVQYWKWLSHFVQGDWGRSLFSNRAVFPEVRKALANTLVLGLIATAFSLLVGVGIGMYSALRQYSWFDTVATGGAFFGLSIPNFWFALLLQLFFGLYLTQWLHLTQPIFFTAGLTKPGAQGFDLLDRARHLALPVLVLAVQEIAVYSRYMRTSMLEVLHSDYLRTARAKGLSERRVIARHAVRNSLIPLTTVASLSIGALAGGLIITEAIFEYPGMGRLFIQAMALGDYLVVLPWLMVAVTFVIAANLVADILYAVLDPRIRYA